MILLAESSIAFSKSYLKSNNFSSLVIIFSIFSIRAYKSGFMQ